MVEERNSIGELAIIKKKYGENMMHLCRSLFPSIIESGSLSTLLLKNFEPSRYLYNDIVENGKQVIFADYIYSLYRNNAIVCYDTDKSPKELLDSVGYDLYECETMDDVNYFIKYYDKEEILCTFNSNRIEECYIFFAIKKDVANIRREDFKYPRKEDLYGTSVLCIQFTRGLKNILSIKNRYNYTVFCPDSTFSNNLDNIVPGLTVSFAKEYKLNLLSVTSKFELPGYVRASDGKYYKYNYKINNIYYCLDNIIVDEYRVIDKYREKEKYLLIDYFIIDLVNKTIKLYDDKLKDSFIDEFNSINNIIITKDKNTSLKTIEVFYDTNKKAIIIVDSINKIIEYHNNYLTNVGNRFISHNKELNVLDTPNLEIVGNAFLRSNECLTCLVLNKIERIGNAFLRNNKRLELLFASNLEIVGNDFCYYNRSIIELYLPKLISVGNNFFYLNSKCNNKSYFS